jgi:hypothetical protein
MVRASTASEYCDQSLSTGTPEMGMPKPIM